MEVNHLIKGVESARKHRGHKKCWRYVLKIYEGSKHEVRHLRRRKASLCLGYFVVYVGDYPVHQITPRYCRNMLCLPPKVLQLLLLELVSSGFYLQQLRHKTPLLNRHFIRRQTVELSTFPLPGWRWIVGYIHHTLCHYFTIKVCLNIVVPICLKNRSGLQN